MFIAPPFPRLDFRQTLVVGRRAGVDARSVIVDERGRREIVSSAARTLGVVPALASAKLRATGSALTPQASTSVRRE